MINDSVRNHFFSRLDERKGLILTVSTENEEV